MKNSKLLSRKIGKLLAQARKRHGMDAVDLAEKLDCSPAFVRKIERGVIFSAAHFLLFAQALDLSLDEISQEVLQP